VTEELGSGGRSRATTSGCAPAAIRSIPRSTRSRHPRRAHAASEQHRARRRRDVSLRRQHAGARPEQLLRGEVLAPARGRRR
jgi:hypothetical protein